jgi:predicted ATPase/DNA-binding SARP family transcriptional activator
MSARLMIFTLGGVRIQRADESITGLTTKKAEALLIYLAATRRPQPREVLAELLWDERTQSQAMANLRGVLTNLRQVLGDYLVITRNTSSINPNADIWLDSVELEDSLAETHIQGPLDAALAHQLAKSLELYQGEFLQGFSVFDCRGFEDWATRERERLYHLTADGYSALVSYKLEQKDFQKGIAFARRLLELDPLMESAHRQMMQLLEASSQRSAALAQFETCQKLLHDELGVEPEVETRRLYEQIRAGTSRSSTPVRVSQIKKVAILKHNLPVQLTSFIGRESEISEIKKLLNTTHLLTLTGVGGTGKTRLALQVAANLVDVFPTGVWLVELASLRDPSQVEPTVATVLGLHEQHGRILSEIILDYLREKQLLLILDNCEHLVEACAKLANALLCRCMKLNILATSRQRLNIAGEAIYPVSPLAIPNLERVNQQEAISQYEAVRLFSERASSVLPTFSLTQENVNTIAQICVHLDGIPLAIELAAARVRHLLPEQILSRLDDRFSLLTGGSRAALPRQQTLLATLEWSYELLSVQEKTLFNRLAVFAGSYSLEAVEAICADEVGFGLSVSRISSSQVLDLLASLVDHSLVKVQERNDEQRYLLLETVRQYALEKLQATSELQVLQDRHLAFFLRFAVQGEPHTWIGDPMWLGRIETEYDNLRSAIEHAIATNLESAILLGKSLVIFADITSRFREVYGWATQILALSDTQPSNKMRAWAIWLAGDRTIYIGDFKQGQEWLEASLEMAREQDDKNLQKYSLQSLTVLNHFRRNWLQVNKYAEQYLAISREIGDNFGIAEALCVLGNSQAFSGDLQTGHTYMEQSLELARRSNFLSTIALALECLAELEYGERDYTKVIAYFTESIQIRRQIKGEAALAKSLYRMGVVMLKIGDAVQARALFEECLIINCELNNFEVQGYCLLGMSGVCVLNEQYERAARLLGAAEAVVERFHSIKTDDSYEEFDPLLTTARESLGDANFNTAWAMGRKLTLEQALELASNV